MKGLKSKLLEEQERLNCIIKYQESQLKGAPTGSLRLSKSHGKLQYYRYSEEDNKVKYIGKTMNN